MSFTLYLIFIGFIIFILLIVNQLFSVSNGDSQKVTYYECGFESYYIMNRTPIAIIYYIVAIIFMVFDIEILFIYPFISSMMYISIYGYYIFIIFFIILTIGLVYEYILGILNFEHLSLILFYFIFKI